MTPCGASRGRARATRPDRCGRGYFNEARRFHGTFDRHVDDLLAAWRRGDPPPVPAGAGRRALELAHATIRSFETGRRVDLPGPEPADKVAATNEGSTTPTWRGLP